MKQTTKETINDDLYADDDESTTTLAEGSVVHIPDLNTMKRTLHQDNVRLMHQGYMSLIERLQKTIEELTLRINTDERVKQYIVTLEDVNKEQQKEIEELKNQVECLRVNNSLSEFIRDTLKDDRNAPPFNDRHEPPTNLLQNTKARYASSLPNPHQH